MHGRGREAPEHGLRETPDSEALGSSPGPVDNSLENLRQAPLPINCGVFFETKPYRQDQDRTLVKAELLGGGWQVGVILSIWYMGSCEAEGLVKETWEDAGRVATPHPSPKTKTAWVCTPFPGPFMRADGHACHMSHDLHPSGHMHNPSVDGDTAGTGCVWRGPGLPSASGSPRGPGAGGTIKPQDLLLSMILQKQ